MKAALKGLIAGFLLCISIIPQELIAQKNPARVDSLKMALNRESPEDSTTVEILIELNKAYELEAPDLAFQYASRAMKLALRLNYQHGLASAYHQLSALYKLRGDWVKQLDYLLKAMKIREEERNVEEQLRLMLSVGSVYRKMGKFEDALELYEHAKPIARQLNNKEILAGLFNNFGTTYGQMGNLDQAKAAFLKAISFSKALNQTARVGITTGNLGHIAYKKKDYKEAEKYYLEELVLAMSVSNQLEIGNSLLNLGKIYQEQGENRKAIQFLLKADSLANKIKAAELRLFVVEVLSDAYKALKNYKQALFYELERSVLTDSLFSDEVAVRVESTELKYKLEKAELELKYQEESKILEQEKRAVEQDAKLKRQRMISGFSAGGVLLLGLLSFVLYRRNKEKKNLNTVLEKKVADRTKALKESHEQLNTLIYRSAHDFKAPINGIQGISELGSKTTDHEKQELFARINEQADQLNYVLDRLVEHVDLTRRPLHKAPIDWHGLSGSLRQSLPTIPGYEGMTIMLSLPGQSIWKSNTSPDDTSLAKQPDLAFRGDDKALLVILTNLLRNGIDFRDDAKKPARVQLSVTDSDSAILIQIEDNGIGMAPSVLARAKEMFYRGSKRSRGNGLGLYIADQLAGRMGGKLEITSKVDSGTQVVISLPK